MQTMSLPQDPTRNNPKKEHDASNVSLKCALEALMLIEKVNIGQVLDVQPFANTKKL